MMMPRMRPAPPKEPRTAPTRIAGRIATKPKSPNPTRAARFSPQVALSSEPEVFTPSQAPLSSIMIAGTTRNVAISQAIPTALIPSDPKNLPAH